MSLMIRLLSTFVSFAMLLTGVPGTAALEAPAGRVVTVGNVVLSYNGEEVALDPFVSMSASTDGQTALYDFFIGADGERYLPFQLKADGEKLLIANDSSGVTVKLTGEDLDRLLADVVDEDDDAQEIMEIYLNELAPAYVDILRMMTDADEMKAMDARGWQLYDEIVDRGEGTPGQVEYEGTVYDAQKYHYTMTGGDLGRLSDAFCQSCEAFDRYSKGYFKMMKHMSEDSVITAADSYEGFLSQLDLTMEIDESLADNGLDIMDGTMTFSAPGLDNPIVYVVHQTRFGENRDSTVSADLRIDGVDADMYLECSQNGQGFHLSGSVTANPDETAEEETTDDDHAAVEGDAADMFYTTFECDLSYNEGGAYTITANLNVELDDGTHYDGRIDGQCAADGNGSWQVGGNLSMDDETYGFRFDVAMTNDVTESRIDESAAVGPDDVDFSALMAGLSGDGMKLYNNESVQKLIGLFTAPDTTDDSADADGSAAADSDLPFARPAFDWLPEDYVLNRVNVEDEYGSVNCVLLNEKTGGHIDMWFSPSYEGDDAAHYARYVIDGDSFSPVEGTLVTEEKGEGYRVYTADKGSVFITCEPSDDAVTATDILNILIGLRFEEKTTD